MPAVVTFPPNESVASVLTPCFAAAFRATGVKVGVKGFRATRTGVDLAFSDQRVAVVVAAGIDRVLADYATWHRSIPKEGRSARGEHRAGRRRQGATQQMLGCRAARRGQRAARPGAAGQALSAISSISLRRAARLSVSKASVSSHSSAVSSKSLMMPLASLLIFSISSRHSEYTALP